MLNRLETLTLTRRQEPELVTAELRTPPFSLSVTRRDKNINYFRAAVAQGYRVTAREARRVGTVRFAVRSRAKPVHMRPSLLGEALGQANCIVWGM